jgi:hypothetical protein
VGSVDGGRPESAKELRGVMKRPQSAAAPRWVPACHVCRTRSVAHIRKRRNCSVVPVAVEMLLQRHTIISPLTCFPSCLHEGLSFAPVGESELPPPRFWRRADNAWGNATMVRSQVDAGEHLSVRPLEPFRAAFIRFLPVEPQPHAVVRARQPQSQPQVRGVFGGRTRLPYQPCIRQPFPTTRRALRCERVTHREGSNLHALRASGFFIGFRAPPASNRLPLAFFTP